MWLRDIEKTLRKNYGAELNRLGEILLFQAFVTTEHLLKYDQEIIDSCRSKALAFNASMNVVKSNINDKF